MKLYKAHWTEGARGWGGSWHHTKKEATDEAKKDGAVPDHWTVLHLQTFDHKENIRRLLNQNWQENIFAVSKTIYNTRASNPKLKVAS